MPRVFRPAGIENVRLPARSPNLNAFAERWVRTVRSPDLGEVKLIRV